MARKKYLVVAGYIHSIRDGQRHWISAARLIELYGVPRHECILASENEPHSLQGRNLGDLIVLRPKNNARRQSYRVPLARRVCETRME